jgi:uncharacterized protein
VEIAGSRIVLTGAASGIGRALLEQLAQQAVQIIAADRDGEGLDQAVAALRQSPVEGQRAAHRPQPAARVVAFVGDLAQRQTVDDLFALALQEMGGIDLFFANAGFGYCERLERADWQRLEEIFRTNTLSPIYSVAKMAEINPEGDSRVVITASVLGRIGLEGYALYGATKAALDRFAEAHRLGGGRPVRLSLAFPLAVRTGFFQAAGGAPLPRPPQSAEQAARAILRDVERDRDEIYTSWLLPVLLFVDRFLPPARRLFQALDSRTFRDWWATGPGPGQR